MAVEAVELMLMNDMWLLLLLMPMLLMHGAVAVGDAEQRGGTLPHMLNSAADMLGHERKGPVV